MKKFKWPLKPKEIEPPRPATDIDIEIAIGRAVNFLLGEADSFGPPRVHRSNVQSVERQTMKELIKAGLIPPTDETDIVERIKKWQ